MSLRPPRLDDRRYDDLREELIRRIPVHAPEWTDHNPADPGITLLELFAELGETLLERFNRVPEAARLAFLKLLGIDPYPARVARAMVRLELPLATSTPILVPWGPLEERLVLTAGEVPFQALEEITVLPLELQTWVKRPVRIPWDPALLIDQLALLNSHLERSREELSADSLETYEAIPLAAPDGGVPPGPLSTAGTIDSHLWLCLLAPKKLLRKQHQDDDLASLRKALADQVLSLGVEVDTGLCGPTDLRRCPDPGGEDARWPLRWAISTGTFRGRMARVDRAHYERLEVLSDGTDGFRRSGTVRLRLPARAADGTVAIGDWSATSLAPPDPDLLGVGDLPPRIENEEDAARVLAWIRVGRRNPSHLPLKVRWLAANVLPVEQAVTSPAPELLGFGDARPNQEVALAHRPVVVGSEEVQVNGTLGWETWQPVPDLALAGPDDPFYRLDPEAGTFQFGDGVHGRIPLPGQAIRCRTYRHGGGVRGNVGAGRINRSRSGPSHALRLKATNPLPASGGADAETVAEASARLPLVLRHNDRAVARDDFADLALETPCADIGRAHCLPRHLPQQREDEVPGVVTLILIPAYDPLHPDEPVPNRDQLRRVCAWLEPRRLVTTELFITPPTYVPFSCSVAVEAEPGAGEETLRRHVELALRQAMAPLPPFGPDGGGWPFGRAVSERDLEAAVLRVQGVRLVIGVLMSGRTVDPLGRLSDATALQVLPLESWQLPSLREVRVVINADPEPLPPPEDGEASPPAGDGDGGSTPPPGDGGSGGTPVPGVRIPLPVVRRIC